MAKDSNIEWTDHTFNPWTGCTNISPGCDNCYAEAWSKRSGHVKWGNSPRKRTTASYWKAPYIWQSKAAQFQAINGRRQRVFCASLADVFDNQVDPAWRSDLFKVIRDTPSLDWQILTKRPQNIKKFLPNDWAEGYANVWLGLTAEDQTRFDQRKRFIKEIPAVVWFVSYEPAIGPLRIRQADPKPDWLISGGESGPGARHTESTWIRNILADCQAFEIAAFLKQWGSFSNNPLVQEHGLSISEAKELDQYGKGGGLLDGKLIREFPVLNQSEYSAA